MKNILFNCYYDSDLNDNIFKLDRVWLSSNNKEIKKDDKNKGFSYFYETLKSKNYNIHTQDYWKKNDKIDIQINFAYHQKIICKMAYLLLPESKEIYEKNDILKLRDSYTKIFCQYDEFVDEEKIFKLNYPFIITKKSNATFKDRPYFSCMISSNKSMKKKYKTNLYNKRFELINWFEKNNSEDFFLYGLDWELPFQKSGMLGRLVNFKNKVLKKKNNLTCYQGIIEKKGDILKKCKFAFCFENSKIDGYISDPIFDVFSYGCIPIYLGAQNIKKYIPSDIFIDFRNFNSFQNLYDHLNQINEKEYSIIQEKIFSFILSENINNFNEKGFSSTILKHLKTDIN